ncbi:hypothetical protein BWI17_03820 [Betaproteobacteria bacterium GR16-43]|nr:hypothetical protein BWI17_03820 [Betaproteobacteria bacterium GR16-43]
MALALIAIGACVGAWVQGGKFGYLVSALGFLVWAPVMYQHPVSFTAPIGSGRKGRRPLSITYSVLTFVGIGLVLVGIGLRWAL